MTFAMSAIIANCLICRPVTYRWAASLVDGSCGDQKSLDMWIAILNLLQDVVTVVLPMPILWGLQIMRKQKMSLSCLFGIGILYGSRNDWLWIPSFGLREADTSFGCRICIITIYRVQATSTINDPTDSHAQNTLCLIALLTSLEALLGIICACLPFLKPLLSQFRRFLSSRGAKPTISSTSRSIPIAMQMSKIPVSSSTNQHSNQYLNDIASAKVLPRYEKEIEGQYEREGSV